jgi:hypothetical protein
METAEAQKPVSVREKMPAENQDVLAWCYFRQGANKFPPRWERAHWKQGRYGPVWHSSNYYDFPVTHWLPMPDAPEQQWLLY